MRDAMIDLSHFNRVGDWSRVRSAGIEAVILKASQGSGYVDSLFGLWKPRVASLFLAGAYTFLAGDDPEAEATEFLNTVDPQPGWRLMIDLERNLPGQRAATVEEAAQVVQILESKFLVPVIVYVGRWQTGLPHPVLSARPLLLPKYGPPPTEADLPPGFTMANLIGWQHTDGVHGYRPLPVDGVNTPCDRSMVFMDTPTLRAWWTSDAGLPSTAASGGAGAQEAAPAATPVAPKPSPAPAGSADDSDAEAGALNAAELRSLDGDPA